MGETHIRLTGPAHAALAEMVAKVGGSFDEVIKDALALMNFAIDATTNRHKIGAFDPVTQCFTAITTPALSRHSESSTPTEP